MARLNVGSLIVAATVYGEARGEGFEGMRAVAHVIYNRLRSGRWGRDAMAVCLYPNAFSCWRGDDPNRILLVNKYEDEADFQAAINATAQAAAEGTGNDPTKGAFNYLNYEWCVANDAVPVWLQKMVQVAKIGHHTFYREK